MCADKRSFKDRDPGHCESIGCRIVVDHIVVDPEIFSSIELKSTTAAIMNKIVLQNEVMPPGASCKLAIEARAAILSRVAIDFKAIPDLIVATKGEKTINRAAVRIDARGGACMDSLSRIHRRCIDTARIHRLESHITGWRIQIASSAHNETGRLRIISGHYLDTDICSG